MGVTGCEKCGSPIRLAIYPIKGSFDVLFQCILLKQNRDGCSVRAAGLRPLRNSRPCM